MVMTIGDFGFQSRGRSPARVGERTVENFPVLNIEGEFDANRTEFFPEELGLPTRNRVGQQGSNPVSIDDSRRFDVEANDIPTLEQERTDALKEQAQVLRNAQQAQFALAGAKLFTNVMNANSQYENISQTARTNIYLANQSANDAISRGKQTALQLESQGRSRGDSAKLALAAQGQDVSGAAVERVVSSQEAAGVYNAMLAEINASREALGFELEAVQYEGQVRRAGLQRDMAYLNSFLNFAASSYPLLG